MNDIELINRVAAIGGWIKTYPDSPHIEGVKQYHHKLLAIMDPQELLTT